MAASFVQFAANFGGTSQVPTNVFNSNVTAGNTVLACVSWSTAGGSVVSVTDSENNQYRQVGEAVQGNSRSCQLWLASNVAGGDKCTVTVTMSSALTASVKLAECSGVSGTAYCYLTKTANGSNPSIGPSTTITAGDLMIGYERGVTPTAVGSGWTETDTQSNNIIYQVAASTTTYTASWTANSGTWVGYFVTLQAGTPIQYPWLLSDIAYAGNSGFDATYDQACSPGNVLQYERTQAWSILSAIRFFKKPPAGGASIIESNVPATGPDFPGYELWVDPSGFLHVRIIASITGNYIGVIGSTDVTDGNWHFVAATYDGSSTAAGVKIYFDGTLETMTIEADALTATIIQSQQSIIIGSQAGRATTYEARGFIDEFSIHNIVRSAAYIAAISPSSLPAVDSNVQLMYHFDEGINNTTADASANGYTGTFTTTVVQVPTVTENVAGSVTQTGAALSGNVTATGGGAVTSWGFNYGLTTAYGSQAAGSGTIGGIAPFTATLTGLTPNTTYHFQGFATNSAGTGVSTDNSFTTLPSAFAPFTGSVTGDAGTLGTFYIKCTLIPPDGIYSANRWVCACPWGYTQGYDLSEMIRLLSTKGGNPRRKWLSTGQSDWTGATQHAPDSAHELGSK